MGNPGKSQRYGIEKASTCVIRSWPRRSAAPRSTMFTYFDPSERICRVQRDEASPPPRPQGNNDAGPANVFCTANGDGEEGNQSVSDTSRREDARPIIKDEVRATSYRVPHHVIIPTCWTPNAKRPNRSTLLQGTSHSDPRSADMKEESPVLQPGLQRETALAASTGETDLVREMFNTPQRH